MPCVKPRSKTHAIYWPDSEIHSSIKL